MIDSSCGISLSYKSCLLWLLFFYGIFRIWEQICINTCYNFLSINSFALLLSGRFNLLVYFRLFCRNTIIKIPSLVRKEKTTCENCGTQTTRNSIVRHKKRCSIRTLYCTQCRNFSSKSQNYLNYHIARKHRAPKLDVTFNCKLCYQEFSGFDALRQRRNAQHGTQVGSRTRNMDVEHIVGDVDDHRLRKELHSC